MTLRGNRIYVGFGFGAIQAGLFLYEAYQSGAFARLVVAEIVPEVVTALRRAGGAFHVNVAHPDHIISARVDGIEIFNPKEENERALIIDALANADEIGTAIPSVGFYATDGAGSLQFLLAEALRIKARDHAPHAVIYTAENNNHAAEILEEVVMEVIPATERDAVKARVRFLNTVIGKMSGVVVGKPEIAAQQLAPITPDGERAFLVEAFNQILISRIDFPDPFERGLAVFEEKADLLPFEEAKLYGHNATHALAAYIGTTCGVEFISQLRDQPGVMAFLRAAFIEESGAALIGKYAGVDALFTEAGYAAYVDDLLARMTNPYLRDTVERVGRDPARKLGWDDRLIGTMRLALSQGIAPHRFALGAAAALRLLNYQTEDSAAYLKNLWHTDSAEQDTVLKLIGEADLRLQQWIDTGFPPLSITG
jgi:mannitol-1-phosphate 5-dehydrogenase